MGAIAVVVPVNSSSKAVGGVATGSLAVGALGAIGSLDGWGIIDLHLDPIRLAHPAIGNADAALEAGIHRAVEMIAVGQFGKVGGD